MAALPDHRKRRAASARAARTHRPARAAPPTVLRRRAVPCPGCTDSVRRAQSAEDARGAVAGRRRAPHTLDLLLGVALEAAEALAASSGRTAARRGAPPWSGTTCLAMNSTMAGVLRVQALKPAGVDIELRQLRVRHLEAAVLGAAAVAEDALRFGEPLRVEVVKERAHLRHDGGLHVFELLLVRPLVPVARARRARSRPAPRSRRSPQARRSRREPRSPPARSTQGLRCGRRRSGGRGGGLAATTRCGIATEDDCKNRDDVEAGSHEAPEMPHAGAGRKHLSRLFRLHLPVGPRMWPLPEKLSSPMSRSDGALRLRDVIGPPGHAQPNTKRHPCPTSRRS